MWCSQQSIVLIKLSQEFSQDFETINHFCGTDFFGLIMNKQECNELTLIISYVALLVSNGD